jgi:hypothetical protein
VSENGSLCQGDGSHEEGQCHRRALMLAILSEWEEVENAIAELGGRT